MLGRGSAQKATVYETEQLKLLKSCLLSLLLFCLCLTTITQVISSIIIIMLLNGSDRNERQQTWLLFLLFNRWSSVENEGMMRFLKMIIEDLRFCWVHVWHCLIKWQMTVLRFKNNFSFSCLLSLATDVVGSWRYRPLEQKLTNTLTNKHPAHPDSFQSLFGICWGLLEKEKVRFEWGYNKITQAYTHLLF